MDNYYAIHTMSGKENKVRDILINRAVAQKVWGKSIVDVLIPTEKEYVTKNGVRKIVDKKIFPGYIFVRMDLDDDTQSLIQTTEGVTGFVRSGTKPIPLSKKEVDNILTNIKSSEDSSPKSSYKTNDVVKISSGPFSDYSGKVESVDVIKGKIKAYVHVFGRDTLVELDMSDVSLFE